MGIAKRVNRLFACAALLFIAGCSRPKPVHSASFADIILSDGSITVLFHRTEGLDRTSSYSHSKNIEVISDSLDLFKGDISFPSSSLSLASTVIRTAGVRIPDAFYATKNPADLFRMQYSSQDKRCLLDLLHSGSADLAGPVSWNYRDSILPRGEMVFNRSRTIFLIDLDGGLRLVDARSLKSTEMNAFVNVRPLGKLSRAILSDDGAFLIAQGDSSGEKIFAVENHGQRREIHLATEGLLSDAENVGGALNFLIKDPLDRRLSVCEENGPVRSVIGLEKHLWDYRNGILYFIGEIDADNQTVSLRRWDYKGGKETKGSIQFEALPTKHK